MRLSALVFITFNIVVFISSGCKSGNSDTSKASQQILSHDKFLELSQDIFPNAHSLSEIMVMIEMTGADYMPGLVNDPQRVSNYMNDSIVGAMNLGVYMADILYAAVYGEVDQHVNSFQAARELARMIGGDSLFIQGQINRLENQTPEVKTVIKNMELIYEETQNELDRLNKERMIAAMLVGNYIEKSYILQSIIYDYPTEGISEDDRMLLVRDLLVILGKQQKAIDSINELFDQLTNEEDPGTLHAEFKKLQELQAALNVEQNIPQLKPAEVFENENLKALYEQVKKIRNIIIDAKAEAV